jgi:hypothetical protein
MIASSYTYHKRLCDAAEIIGSNLQGRICGKMIRKQISRHLQLQGSSSDTHKKIYFFIFKSKIILETIDLIKLCLTIDFYGWFMTILEISHFSNQRSSGFKTVFKNQF